MPYLGGTKTYPDGLIVGDGEEGNGKEAGRKGRKREGRKGNGKEGKETGRKGRKRKGWEGNGKETGRPRKSSLRWHLSETLYVMIYCQLAWISVD